MSFHDILGFIQSQNEFIVYAILFVSAFIENVFPPFPGDTTTLAGAFVAGEGNIGYIGVLISVTLGGVLGAMTLYYIGLIKGRHFFEKRDSRYFGRESLLKVESLFQKYGGAVITFSRFMAGIRSAIALAAGVGNVAPVRMMILSLVSNILWNGFLIGLMIYTKSNWIMIIDLVKRYHIVLLSVGALIIIILILKTKWIKRKN